MRLRTIIKNGKAYTELIPHSEWDHNIIERTKNGNEQFEVLTSTHCIKILDKTDE